MGKHCLQLGIEIKLLKRWFTTCCLLFFAFFVQAQIKYSRIELEKGYLIELAKQGMAVDDGVITEDNKLIIELSEIELQKLNQIGIPYKVVIDNVTEFYVERNRKQSKNIQNIDDIPVPAGFSLGSMGGYCTLSQIYMHLDTMHARYPQLISAKQSLGSQTTQQGRQLYWVKISDHPDMAENENRILFTALHHAREPIGMQQMLFFMYYLLENYDSNSYIHQLLDTTEIFFIPCVNPDGYEFNHQVSPNGGGMWRKNRRENPDNSYGVDLNRNYGYMWGCDNLGSSSVPSSEIYRGPFAFSEPEIQMIRDFAQLHNFSLVFNYHAYSNTLLYPWGFIEDTTSENNIFKNFAFKLTDYNACAYGPASLMLYLVNGNSDDWFYAGQLNQQKAFSFTPEIGDNNQGFWPSFDQIIPLCQDQVNANLLAIRLGSRYGEISQHNELFFSQNQSSISFQFKRYGLEEGVTYKVTLQPLSNLVESVGQPVYFIEPELLVSYIDSISFSVSQNILPGDEIKLLLTLDDGYFTHSDTLTLIFGVPYPIFSDDCSTMENWSSNKWGNNSFVYNSPPASITDSPVGNYSSNANTSIISSQEFDLTDAKAAMLSYHTLWDIERRYDFIQVLASVDQGQQWVPLMGKYTSLSSNPLVMDQPVYQGSNLEWVKEEINLNRFTGQKLKIKFALKSNQFINKDGFYFDDFSVQIIDKSTGINPSEQNNRILYTIFPNPAKDAVHISIGHSITAQSIEVSLYDIFGKLFLRQVFPNSIHRIDLNLANLPSGLYFISIEAAGEPVIWEKLLVLH